MKVVGCCVPVVADLSRRFTYVCASGWRWRLLNGTERLRTERLYVYARVELSGECIGWTARQIWRGASCAYASWSSSTRVARIGNVSEPVDKKLNGWYVRKAY